jgi:hypothetical protein
LEAIKKAHISSKSEHLAFEIYILTKKFAIMKRKTVPGPPSNLVKRDSCESETSIQMLRSGIIIKDLKKTQKNQEDPDTISLCSQSTEASMSFAVDSKAKENSSGFPSQSLLLGYASSMFSDSNGSSALNKAQNGSKPCFPPLINYV